MATGRGGGTLPVAAELRRRPGRRADTVIAMRDSEIAALLADGDPRGLEAAYAAYADRIHDYARGMLRNASPDAAADVTHDTFLIAMAKAGSLRDRDRLRAWLYAIARNECLRVLRTSKRSAPLESAPEPTVEGSAEMSQGLAASERRALVLAAAEGLSPKDREVFELGMRHDLSAREVAASLGVSDNAAHAMLSRVRAQFERSLGALLVARQGRGGCADLNQMLADWDGTYGPLWRKRLARHVTGCATCREVERRELSPAALLAVLPMLPAPALVRSRLFEDQTDLVAHSRGLADRAGPWDVEGFPTLQAAGRRRPALLAVVAVLLLLFGIVESVRLLTRDGGNELLEPAVASTTTSEPVVTTYLLADQATLLPRPVKKKSPSPTVTPTVEITSAAPTTLAPVPPPSSTPAPVPTTRTPKPKPTPTVAPAPPGRLIVPTGLLIRRATGGNSFVIRAVGGRVDWTASSSTGLAGVSPASGRLADGAATTVTVTVGRATPETFVVLVGPGGHQVNVTVIG